jgi:hypothetical protein
LIVLKPTKIEHFPDGMLRFDWSKDLCHIKGIQKPTVSQILGVESVPPDPRKSFKNFTGKNKIR